MRQQGNAERFERSQDEKVERVFDDICQLTMAQLRSLSEAMCSRLSLRVIGGFVEDLDKVEPPASAPEPEVEKLTVKVERVGSGSRVDAIKAARAILGLGLKESRDFVESLPAFIEKQSAQEAQDEAKRWREGGFETELA